MTSVVIKPLSFVCCYDRQIATYITFCFVDYVSSNSYWQFDWNDKAGGMIDSPNWNAYVTFANMKQTFTPINP